MLLSLPFGALNDLDVRNAHPVNLQHWSAGLQDATVYRHSGQALRLLEIPVGEQPAGRLKTTAIATLQILLVSTAAGTLMCLGDLTNGLVLAADVLGFVSFRNRGVLPRVEFRPNLGVMAKS